MRFRCQIKRRRCSMGESTRVRTVLRGRSIRVGCILVVLAVALTSCSWPWEAKTSSNPDSVKVAVVFPGAPATLKAKVEPLQTSQEMTAALPSGVQLHEGVSLSMASGDFPESGADVTFRLDAPLAEDRMGTVVYWNPADQTWEPVESFLSADRLTPNTIGTALTARLTPIGARRTRCACGEDCAR